MEADFLQSGHSELPKSDENHNTSGSSRFEFKSNKRRSDESVNHNRRHTNSARSRSPHKNEWRGDSSNAHRRKSRRRSHKRRRRTNDRVSADEESAENQHNMDPDVAFREALFDAMADDEGAAYWEGVYGQPLHIYPTTKAGPDGELERMSDEDYVAYVRARMYEKTHQHVMEERERRNKAREEAKAWAKENERVEANERIFQARIDDSLRRGEERRLAREWREAWPKYLKTWEQLNAKLQNPIDAKALSGNPLEDLIPWPVKSRKMDDVGKDEIEEFFRHVSSDRDVSISINSRLKVERVRWHPDKMLQRFGSLNIDVKTMRAITAVFQVIDKMYADTKPGTT